MRLVEAVEKAVSKLYAEKKMVEARLKNKFYIDKNYIVIYNEENKKCVQLGISPSGIYQNGRKLS